MLVSLGLVLPVLALLAAVQETPGKEVADDGGRPAGVLGDAVFDGPDLLIDLGPGDEVLEGGGLVRWIHYRAPADLRLYLGAFSDEVDPSIVLCREDGEIFGGNDDFGGELCTDAVCSLSGVQEGQVVFLGVASAAPEQAGRVRFRIYEATEDARSEQRLAALLDLARRSAASLTAGDLGAARDVLRGCTELLWPAEETTSNLERLVGQIAALSSQLGLTEQAIALLERQIDFLRRAMPERSERVQTVLHNLATAVHSVGRVREAQRLFEQCHEVVQRSHGPHQELRLDVAAGLAATCYELDQLDRSEQLFRHVLEMRSEVLAPGAEKLEYAKVCLARVLHGRGSDVEAEALLRGALEMFARFPPQHAEYSRIARTNLVQVLRATGRHEEALAVVEAVLAEALELGEESHSRVQAARGNLALVLLDLGRLDEAEWQLQRCLETTTAPEDSPTVVSLRTNLAIVLQRRGRYSEALRERREILAINERLHAADSTPVQKARVNLAATHAELEDYVAARRLQEIALEHLSAKLGSDHPLTLVTGGNLSTSLAAMGDLEGARALQERCIAALVAMPHPPELMLCTHRVNLAKTLYRLGRVRESMALLEWVVETRERLLEPGDLQLVIARSNLAVALSTLGEHDRARAIQEWVLRHHEAQLEEGSPHLIRGRQSLASTMSKQGEHDEAVALYESVLERREDHEAEDYPYRQTGLHELSMVHVRRGDRDAARDSMRRLYDETLRRGGQLPSLSRRQLERRALSQRRAVDWILSYSVGDPECFSDAEQFRVAELLRAAGAIHERVLRRQAIEDEEARREIEELDREILGLRTSLGDEAFAVDDGASFAEAVESYGVRQLRIERREAQRLERCRRAVPGIVALTQADPATLGDRLPVGSVAISYWRYEHRDADLTRGKLGPPRVRLIAFVLHPDGAVQRVELGDESKLERTLHETLVQWDVPTRDVLPFLGEEPIALPSEALRRMVLDPLVPLIDGAKRLVLVPDGLLRRVPLGALPWGTAEQTLADAFEIETRLTLKELLAPPVAPSSGQDLAIVGGLDYGSEPGDHDAERPPDAAEPPTPRRTVEAFQELPGTARELEAIASSFRASPGRTGEIRSFTASSAKRSRLLQDLPRARFVHVATHGYLEQDSARALRSMDFAETPSLDLGPDIRGLSPLSLTGLALSGANHSESEGRLRADTIADLCLRDCELIVFSACASHLGPDDWSQGLQSLQHAAYIAGAENTLSAAWPVPDEATSALMTELYRRWWIEGEPLSRALHGAQRWMREQRDDRGQPRFGLRDWAGWVLVGPGR